MRNRYYLWRYFTKLAGNLLTPNSDVHSSWERKNIWLRRSGLSIGHKVAVDRGFQCLTGAEETITIKDNTAIGMNCHIWNFNSVSIGKFCMLAADVIIANGGHKTDTFEPFSGPLTIGNGCWIGTGARLIGTITIGDNAIVAAGAVVVHDVTAGDIVAGVPARVIGKRNLSDKVWHFGNRYFSPYNFEELT